MKKNADQLSRRTFLEKSSALLMSAASLGAATLAAEDPRPARPLDPARKVRLGVVGGGFGASFPWREHPNCIVHAVSDLRPDRRDHLMKTYQCGRAYESLERLLLDPEIEAVALFTGAPDHARHAIAILDAGKHCLCAVPAALDLEDCQALVEAKRRSGRRYMMAETSYYRFDAIAARDLYREGKFGEIFYSEVEYYHPLDDAERRYYYYHEGKRTWRYGYPPMLYPTHSTGFLVGVTRERLAAVSCLGWGNPELKEYYPGNAYQNPFNAQVAIFQTDKGHISRCNVIFDGTEHGERAQWFGTRLSYFMAGSSGQPFRIAGKEAPDWKEAPRFWERLPEPLRRDSGHGGSHPFIAHEFIAALVEDREPAVDLYESLAMTAPGIAAHQSALRGGEQMKVPSFDPKS
ncbi:MAG: Gfo/Idh/MocA family oxidoreductase [Planctomycetes bacterium]|nr:Gfo/Idh/MocA family oxidoreductase [Planctomycetota bacterium]